MKYRILGRTGLKASEVCLGSETFVNHDVAFARDLLIAAPDVGINYFASCNPEPYVRDTLGRAMQGRRENFILRTHLCSALW